MNTKTTAIIIVAGAAIIGLFFAIRDSNKNQGQEKTASLAINQSAEEVISQRGIHWHSELSITIKGERQPIPANIGIGMQYASYSQYDSMMMMTDMHTHDASGQLHWEVMKGPVKKRDVRLGTFFSVWGKKFSSSCIFDYCNGSKGRLIFKVNGQNNQDFENYLVKDKDEIEIIFE